MRNVRDLCDAAEKCRKDGDRLGVLFYEGAAKAAAKGLPVEVWDNDGRRTIRGEAER